MKPACACVSRSWVRRRERKAGWYGTTAWLVHRMTEELVYAAAYSAVLACALFFPMRLHGSFTVFWVAYFLSYSFGIGDRRYFRFPASVAVCMHTHAALPMYACKDACLHTKKNCLFETLPEGSYIAFSVSREHGR